MQDFSRCPGGLVLTNDASGAFSALSVIHAVAHSIGFDEFAREAPCILGALILYRGL